MFRWRWRRTRCEEIDIVGVPVYRHMTGAYAPTYVDHTAGRPVQPLADRQTATSQRVPGHWRARLIPGRRWWVR